MTTGLNVTIVARARAGRWDKPAWDVNVLVGSDRRIGAEPWMVSKHVWS